MRTADSLSGSLASRGRVGSFARISIHERRDGEEGAEKLERDQRRNAGNRGEEDVHAKKGIVDAPASALNNSPLFDERFESSAQQYSQTYLISLNY